MLYWGRRSRLQLYFAVNVEETIFNTLEIAFYYSNDHNPFSIALVTPHLHVKCNLIQLIPGELCCMLSSVLHYDACTGN